MRKKIIILLLLSFLFSAGVLAMDGIAGKVSASLDYSFTNKWYKTVGESVPYLSTTPKVYKNQEFILYPIMVAYQLDSNSIARVNYDIKILRPDSSVYYESYDVKALDANIHNPQFVMLAESLLEINFEDEDPLGTYIIDITLKDLNSKHAVTVSTSVDLVEFKRVGGFEHDSIMTEWMQNYFSAPNPEAAIDACVYVANKKEIANFLDLSLSFFRELFNHNQYLIPYLENEFFSQPDEAAAYIGTLLAVLDYDQKPFMLRLTPEQVKWFEEMKAQESFLEINNITNPTQLDMLWAQFFAGGSNEPIAKIVSALALKQNSNMTEDSLATMSDEQKLLYSTYKAASWSLEVNAATYQLVFNYLNYIYEHETIPDIIKSELGAILNK